MGPDQNETLDGFRKKNDDLETYGIPGIYFNEKQQRQTISVKAALNDNKKETQRYELMEFQLFERCCPRPATKLKLLPLFHYVRSLAGIRTGVAMPAVYNTVNSARTGNLSGLKMYTGAGSFVPADFHALTFLQVFYRRFGCVVEKIPIINHCTPQGSPTFDKNQYIAFRHPMDNDAEEEARKTREAKVVLPVMVNPMDAALHRMPRPGTFVTMRETKPAGEYFNEEFVSPAAWRKVLESKVGQTRLDTLRICLAHFGGGTKLG